MNPQQRSAGGSFGLGAAVNDHSVVVGIAENAIQDPTGFAAANGIGGTTELHAFLWNGGSLRDLGTLGGPGAFALDINSSNQVIRFSLAAAALTRRFFWRPPTM